MKAHLSVVRDAATSAAAYLPDGASLSALRKAAAGCRGCELYKRATQTVFGEGDAHAAVVFVGEQPGDYEDRAGHPFVGPAGRILDEALRETGLDRRGVYITNAVKHFKWEPLGRRRKHKKPVMHEIRACHPWLEAELSAVRPRLVVCLGATAAQAMLGRIVRITSERGKVQDSPSGIPVLVTVHPSSILRAPEPADRDREYARLVQELALVRRRLDELPRTTPDARDGGAAAAPPRRHRS
jgi:uracil-DNA glycosylase